MSAQHPDRKKNRRTHWSSYSEIKELDGTITITPVGAACLGIRGQHADQKLKLGVREDVDCKTCIRMRDALKAREEKAKGASH